MRAMFTLGQLPVGPSIGPAAAVLILGAHGVASSAAAGVLLAATGASGSHGLHRRGARGSARQRPGRSEPRDPRDGAGGTPTLELTGQAALLALARSRDE